MSEKLERDQPDSPDSSEIATRPGPPFSQPQAPDLPAEAHDFRPELTSPAERVVTPAADASLEEGGGEVVAATQAQEIEEAEQTTPVQAPPVKSFWREVLETVLLTIMIFFLVKGLVANFRIQGSSMEPSFHTNQLVLVNKAAYFHFDVNAWLRLVPGVKAEGEKVVWLFGGPKRGDVVIFEPPDVHDEDYIKRVIGLPGDKVEVRGGKVYVNEVPVDEPYIREAPFSPYSPTVVPPNNLFVMGDNRNASRDSRSFGMLPVDKIVGKAMLVYWPFGDKWGVVPEVKYK